MSNTGNTLINTKGDVVSNLNSEIISIGRANNSDIYLANRQISRNHAQIINKNNNYYIKDLGSGNGTEILRNNETIPLSKNQEFLIKNDDRIIFGESEELIFVNQMDTIRVDKFSTIPNIGKDQWLYVDLENNDVKVDGKIIEKDLSPKEFALLKILYETQGKLCLYSQIKKEVWPKEYKEGYVINNADITKFIYLLKRKIVPTQKFLVMIKSKDSRGYILDKYK